MSKYQLDFQRNKQAARMEFRFIKHLAAQLRGDKTVHTAVELSASQEIYVTRPLRHLVYSNAFASIGFRGYGNEKHVGHVSTDLIMCMQ